MYKYMYICLIASGPRKLKARNICASLRRTILELAVIISEYWLDMSESSSKFPAQPFL